jgi:5-methylcytosine-specific restriction enzyme A
MAERNPAWSRDELILALDLYMDDPASPPGKTSPEIAILSDYLNRLGAQIDTKKETFRNTNGAYMKLMNFRRFDPPFIDVGKVGLQRGGKLEEAVWNDFSGDRDRLRRVAVAIRTAIDSESAPTSIPDEDDEIAEAQEGRILTRVHRSRERSRKLVERKKTAALKVDGRLACEVCGFDFEATSGPRGTGVIECHHIKPVHTLTDGSKTKLTDLVLVCSNCHRMIHAGRPWLTVGELRGLLGSE